MVSVLIGFFFWMTKWWRCLELLTRKLFRHYYFDYRMNFTHKFHADNKKLIFIINCMGCFDRFATLFCWNSLLMSKCMFFYSSGQNFCGISNYNWRVTTILIERYRTFQNVRPFNINCPRDSDGSLRNFAIDFHFFVSPRSFCSCLTVFWEVFFSLTVQMEFWQSFVFEQLTRLRANGILTREKVKSSFWTFDNLLRTISQSLFIIFVTLYKFHSSIGFRDYNAHLVNTRRFSIKRQKLRSY